MNWVGGARSRIKMKEEKKKQTEFFDKNRAQKLAKDGKTPTPKLSQDMIHLQIIENFCQNELERPCDPIVRKIDLSKKIPTVFDKKKRQLELPMSPISMASKLDFQGAVTETRPATQTALHGNKCRCFNPKMCERPGNENRHKMTKYSTGFGSGDIVHTTPLNQLTTDDFNSFLQTPVGSTQRDPMMYNPLISPMQFTDDNFPQKRSFSGRTSNLFDRDYQQLHASSSEDFQSPLASIPFQNTTINTPYQFSPYRDCFRQSSVDQNPENNLSGFLFNNHDETSNVRREKESSLISVGKICEETSKNVGNTQEDEEDPIMDTCESNEIFDHLSFKKSDVPLKTKRDVPTVCLEPREERKKWNLVVKRDGNRPEKTPEMDSFKSKNNFQVINYNNFSINIQPKTVQEVAEHALTNQIHEKKRDTKEISTQTSPLVYCSRCALFQKTF